MKGIVFVVLFGLAATWLAFFIWKKSTGENPGQINLVGLSFRTTNRELIETGAAQLTSAIDEVISGQVNAVSRMFIVYSDYEDGFASDLMSKQYAVFVGFELPAGESIDGLSLLTIPPQKYRVFKAERGDVGRVVPEAWRRIWGDAQLQKSRTFAYDFELYNGNIARGNVQVEIYIGIK